MTCFVVDASVAAKWYLPEPYVTSASRLLDTLFQLHAPDLLFPEIGNILWKRVIRKELSREKAFVIIEALLSVPFQITESHILLPSALDIACRSKRSVYDGLYVALAEHIGCPLVTADLKLYNALKKSPLKKSIIWVEDVS